MEINYTNSHGDGDGSSYGDGFGCIEGFSTGGGSGVDNGGATDGGGREDNRNEGYGCSIGDGIGHGYDSGHAYSEGRGEGSTDFDIILSEIGVPDHLHKLFTPRNMLAAQDFVQATTQAQRDAILGMLELAREH